MLCPIMQSALERGEFRLLGPRQENPPDMKRVCSVALDIASGMAVLHKHDVVHGGALPLDTLHWSPSRLGNTLHIYRPLRSSPTLDEA